MKEKFKIDGVELEEGDKIYFNTRGGKKPPFWIKLIYNKWFKLRIADRFLPENGIYVCTEVSKEKEE